MFVTRSVAHFVALAGLAAGLAGCGGSVGQMGALPPAHTESFPTEPASPLPVGADALTALQQRPMRPPAPATHPGTTPNETCTASSIGNLGSIVPNYGAGVGPAYLSGQDSWYSSGQAAILMVDSKYSGPLLVRAFQLGGGGTPTLTLADFPSPDPSTGLPVIKQEPGVAVVSALHATGGGLFFGAVAASSSWREWNGLLSTDGPGCFGLQVDGDVFTEFILFVVNPGKRPGG